MDSDSVQLREEYVTHINALLKLIGTHRKLYNSKLGKHSKFDTFAGLDGHGYNILNFETVLANFSMTPAQMRDMTASDK